MRTVRIHAAARRELADAVRWYREQGAAEASTRLLAETDEAIDKLRRFAHAYRVVDHTASGVPTRRVRLRRFPYMLVFAIDAADVVRVVAFAHERRDRYWTLRE